MAETHALSALFDKYAEILGHLKQAERQANSHSESLAHIEAVIRLYRPEWTADGVKARKPHKPPRWPSRGAGMRMALAILRDATEPLTTREIVVRVLEIHNMPEPDYDDLKLICSSFNSALRNKAARGGLTLVDGFPKRWVLDTSPLFQSLTVMRPKPLAAIQPLNHQAETDLKSLQWSIAVVP